MRKGFVAIAVALAVAAPASAQVPRQVGTLEFTTSVPGASTGTDLSVVFQNPDDPNAKPYASQTMVIHMPSGTVMDTTVPPQCHATDAEIYVEGHTACPAETQIGSGWAYSDTGGSGDSRYTRTTLWHYNNQDEVVGIGEVDQTPEIKTIDRTKIAGDTTTSNFPLFPGFPPPEPYTPVKSLDIHFPPYSRNGRAYNRTPRYCPASGHWTFVIDFVYRDGVTQSISSDSPCVGHRKG